MRPSRRENTSKQVTVTFVPMSGFGFTRCPTYPQQPDVRGRTSAQYRTAEALWATPIDQLCRRHPRAGSEPGVSPQDGYTITGNSVQVPYTKRVNIFGDVKGMMRANQVPLRRGLDIVAMPVARPFCRNLRIFGAQRRPEPRPRVCRRPSALHQQRGQRRRLRWHQLSGAGLCLWLPGWWVCYP